MPTNYGNGGKKYGSQFDANVAFNETITRYWKKFRVEAKKEIKKALEKMASDEEINIKSRLKNLDKYDREAGRKVAHNTYWDLVRGSMGKPTDKKLGIIELGATETFGEGRSSNVDLAWILAKGKKRSAPIGQGTNKLYRFGGNEITQTIRDRKLVYGGNWGSHGRKSGGPKLPLGFVSPAREPNYKFLGKAMDNIKKKIEPSIEKALREAFGEISEVRT